MKKLFTLLSVFAMAIVLCSSTPTKAAYELPCPECDYPYANFMCRGSYYATYNDFHHDYFGETCTYYYFNHGNNIKCKFGHMTYTDYKHTAGHERHSAGCPRRVTCSGVGTILY